MKNYVQPGDKISVRVESDKGVDSGELVVIHSLVGVAVAKALKGEEVIIATEGVFELPRSGKEEIPVGKELYASSEGLTTVKASHTYVGLAIEFSPAGAQLVKARLG